MGVEAGSASTCQQPATVLDLVKDAIAPLTRWPLRGHP
jgi:hypothetical protein